MIDIVKRIETVGIKYGWYGIMVLSAGCEMALWFGDHTVLRK